MSIKVMSLVWDRFEGGGGELLLALALADFAGDDGRNIYPSILTLAKKTRLSTRTVQRHLAEFRRTGWLILETPGGMVDGRGLAATYRINVDWIRSRGDKLSPIPAQRGDTGDAKGCHPRRGGVTPATHRGDTAMSSHPSSDPPSDPSKKPSERFALSPGEPSGKKPKKTRAATRLPDDFELTDARRKFAEQEGVDPLRTFAKFRDHWRAASGKNATKRDWEAAWRNWCRRETEFKRDRLGAIGGRPSPAEIEADQLRKLKERRHGMTSGMSNFRDPHPGESSNSYREAMNREHDRRIASSEPRFQQNVQQLERKVAELTKSKRMPP